MKRLINLILFTTIITLSCTTEIENKSENTAEINSIIIQLADKYLASWNSKNLNSLDSLIAEDGKFYGSDPDEIMDKAALFGMYTSFFSDTTSDYQYTVNMRNIKIAANGKSAIVMERIIFPAWSPKMPMCQTSHFIKTGDSWKIDFISWGFIIKNEDVPKLNHALK